MYKLCVKLPPFSPDYSGVCSALYALGGLVVIHDAAGCTGNYTGYDEPRWYGSDSMVYCSSLREVSAVLGDESVTIEKIVTAARERAPKFIAILGSPVPMVIGTDLQGIAKELENRTGLPSFGFSTTGLGYYDKGAGEAFVRLARHFVKQPQEKLPKAINLLGATPLDFGVNDDIQQCKIFFEKAGFTVLCDYAMLSSLEDIQQSGKASANVVLSASGLPVAKHFYREFGTPYVCGVPIGANAANALIARLEQAMQTGKPHTAPESSIKSEGQTEKDVLIVHDQIVANSLRLALQDDFGKKNVHVATPFGFDTDISVAGDAQARSELELTRLFNSGYDTIIADPLLAQVLPPDNGVAFIPLPQVAVSSKLYWHNTPNLVGNAVDALLQNI